jgi:hypothetical protein
LLRWGKYTHEKYTQSLAEEISPPEADTQQNHAISAARGVQMLASTQAKQVQAQF